MQDGARQTKPIREAVEGEAGYATGLKLRDNELVEVRQLIIDHWLDNLQRRAPQHARLFEEIGITRYHENAHLVRHSEIWPKLARILPAEAATRIRATSLLQRLVEEFGNFTISDEDNLGWELMYWRLVRPHENADLGSLHADSWFWTLAENKAPPGTHRVKCWIGIFCEPGLNGLEVVPGSHLREWRYHGEMRHGSLKPEIDEDIAALHPQLLPLEPGDAVVFHDNLLHGGALNRGEFTRVSLEFTMFVNDN